MRTKYEIEPQKTSRITESVNQYASELNSIFSQAIEKKETKGERTAREAEVKKNKEEISNFLNKDIQDLKKQREEVVKAGPGEVPSRQKKELERLDKEIARQELELQKELKKLDKPFKEHFIEEQLNKKAEKFGNLFKMQRGTTNEFRERFVKSMQTKDYEGAAKVLLDAHLAKSILEETGQKVEFTSFSKAYKAVRDNEEFKEFKKDIDIKEQKTFAEQTLSALVSIINKLIHKFGKEKAEVKEEKTGGGREHQWKHTERFKRRKEREEQQRNGVIR